MRLYISSISDVAINFLDNEYVKITAPLRIERLKQNLEHNQAILEIALTLSYAKFDDLKDYESAKKVWDRLKTIYVGNDNVLREK